MDFAAIFSLENGTFRFIAGTEDPHALASVARAVLFREDRKLRKKPTPIKEEENESDNA